MPKVFTLKRGSLLATIAMAGATVLFLLLFLKPRHDEIMALRNGLEEKRQFLEASGLIGDSVQQTARDLEQVSLFVDQWRSLAPKESQLAAVYAEIARNGKTAGVKIARFEPLPNERMESIWSAPLKLRVEGGYDQVFDFIHRMEQMKAAASIQELKLERANAGESAIASQALSEQDLACEIKWEVFADYAEFSD